MAVEEVQTAEEEQTAAREVVAAAAAEVEQTAALQVAVEGAQIVAADGKSCYYNVDVIVKVLRYLRQVQIAAAAAEVEKPAIE